MFCSFPVLEELFRLKLCPLEPIYVANFSDIHEYDDDEDSDYLAGKQAAFDGMFARYNVARALFYILSRYIYTRALYYVFFNKKNVMSVW